MILRGIKELLASPSGVFACIFLAALSYVTIHSGLNGTMATAWVAFATVIPAVLAICEHRETLAQMIPPPPSLPPSRGRL